MLLTHRFRGLAHGVRVFCFLFVATATAIGTARAEPATHDDIARLFAGVPVRQQSDAYALTRSSAWSSHASAMDRAWRTLEARQITPIRRWSARHLPEPRSTLLYMFSGPDFLYADAFYDKADTYILAGLEPIGRIPRLDDAMGRNLSGRLSSLRSSLRALLSYSFFRTVAMKTDLRSRNLEGTLPVLYLFLVRSGKTIHNVNLVELDGQGRLIQVDEANADPFRKGPAQGVEIEFSGADKKVRKLYYFRTDLSDGGMPHNGFPQFVATFGTVDAFIKSASYLLHSGAFSQARQLLLANAGRIVEDDTGLPLAAFPKGQWDFKPFGRYTGPISLFPGRYQTSMRELFRKSPGTLEFGIGYRYHRSESSLLLAIKRDAKAQGATAEQAR